MCDRWTDRQTTEKWTLSVTLLCRRHKNFMLFYTQTQVGGRTGSRYHIHLLQLKMTEQQTKYEIIPFIRSWDIFEEKIVTYILTDRMYRHQYNVMPLKFNDKGITNFKLTPFRKLLTMQQNRDKVCEHIYSTYLNLNKQISLTLKLKIWIYYFKYHF